MPPRVHLSASESERLLELIGSVESSRLAFPFDADASTQVGWIQERYSSDSPLSLNLVTLLLFEHGIHRSVDQVAQDLAILRGETTTGQPK